MNSTAVVNQPKINNNILNHLQSYLVHQLKRKQMQKKSNLKNRNHLVKNQIIHDQAHQHLH